MEKNMTNEEIIKKLVVETKSILLLKQHDISLHWLKDSFDLVVFRCEGCALDLEDYNPYVYDDGRSIPLDKIKVVLVDNEYCENNEENMSKKPQEYAPIPLYKLR